MGQKMEITDPTWLATFQHRIKQDSECWLWTKGQSTDGYGRVTYLGQTHNAHKLSYELIHGIVPHGTMVMHDCDIRLCVRPKHLLLGSRGDNNTDRMLKGRNANRQGENNTDVKLTEQQVLEIRRQHALGLFTLRMLAQDYKVSSATIRLIVRRKRWLHI